MEPKIAIGRIVHVVLKDKNQTLVHRPAVIVRTWGSDPAKPESIVNVQVFLDGTNDFTAGIATLWMTSVRHQPEATEEYTWHWPERD